jgi:hypothetical protein
MTPQETLTQAAMAYRQADRAQRPTMTAMLEALVTAEKQAKRDRQVIPESALHGQWRLCFVGDRQTRQQAGQLRGRGRYVPQAIPAQISFQPQGTIGNQLQLGGLEIKFSGPFVYPGKKNLLVFDFTHLQVQLFGLKLYAGRFSSGKKAGSNRLTAATETVSLQPAQHPFFAFFATHPQWIAARGRGGGLALWIRANQESETTAVQP